MSERKGGRKVERMKTRRIEERRRVAARRGTARHNWPPRCKYTCTSYAPTRVFFCVGWFVEVPAADRDQGESGSGLGSKMLHERVHVRRCNWSFVRSFARSFVRSFVRSFARSLARSLERPVRTLSGAYVRMQLAIHPPFAKEPRLSPVFTLPPVHL